MAVKNGQNLSRGFTTSVLALLDTILFELDKLIISTKTLIASIK